jgi:hypothetical protein
VKKVREIGRFKLTNKYTTARENMKERIEIVRVRPFEPVKEE